MVNFFLQKEIFIMAEEKDKKVDEAKKAEVKTEKKEEKKAEPAAKKEEPKKEEKKAEPEKEEEAKVEIKKEEPKVKPAKVEQPKKAEPEKKADSEFHFVEKIKMWKSADIKNAIPFMFTGNIKFINDLTDEVAVVEYLQHGYGLVNGYVMKADLK